MQSVRAGFNSWVLDSRRVTDFTMEKKPKSISIKQPSTNYGIAHLLENKFMHIQNRVNPEIDARTSPLAFEHYRLIDILHVPVFQYVWHYSLIYLIH